VLKDTISVLNGMPTRKVVYCGSLSYC